MAVSRNDRVALELFGTLGSYLKQTVHIEVCAQVPTRAGNSMEAKNLIVLMSRPK